jgi:hypothetical protein
MTGAGAGAAFGSACATGLGTFLGGPAGCRGTEKGRGGEVSRERDFCNALPEVRSKGRTAFESLTLLFYDGFERRPSPNRRSAKVGGIPDDAPDPVPGLDERVVRREDIRSASLGWR